MDISELKDFDNFFYYGSGELKDEVKCDMHQLLMQPKRSLYYSRSRDCAGIIENAPIGMKMKVLLPYDIVSAIAKRNNYVGNGQNGTEERRVATSQNQVKVTADSSNVTISVYYLPYYNLVEGTNATTEMGTSH